MSTEKGKVRRKKYRRDPHYKTKKIVLIIVISVIVLVLAIIGVFLYFLYHYKYKPLNQDYTVAESIRMETIGETGVAETTREDTAKESIDAYEEEAKKALEELKKHERPLDNIYNVLLIGSDSRSGHVADGRADTTLLLSINYETGEIVMTSFLRDLYVYIPKRECYDKLNSAFQYGGVELLIDTIRYNFSIEVDRYINVDFYAFMKVVDILGGLDVDIQEEELYWFNQYVHASNLLLIDDGDLTPEQENDGYFDYADGSFQHMNGKQVLAYSRFRYVGNADFSRTERQRKVLTIAYEKLKTISVVQAVQLLDQILPEITTNIDRDEMVSLLMKVPDMMNYKINSWSVPDTQYSYITIGGQSNISIDFTYYVNRMYDAIYGVTSTESGEN